MKRSAAKKVPPLGPFTVSDESRMSEDYILTADLILDAAAVSPLAAVKSQTGRWTPLAVIADRGLVHVIPEQKSHSGWDLLPMPHGSAAKEVVATLDGTGTNHAFFQDGSNTYHCSLGSDGTWSDPDILSAAASLGVANVPLSSDPVATGITSDGNLLFIRKDWSSGQWKSTTCDMGGALIGAQAVLSMSDSENWTLAAVVVGKLQYFSGNGSTLGSGPYEVKTANTVTRIHFAYQRAGSTMVMFSDDQQILYTSFGFSDQAAPIPGSKVAQGAAVIDKNQKIHFYGADPAGKLWVLHQKGWDSNEQPTWVHIFPLDVNVAAVASPQSALDGAVLFAAGVDQTLHAMSQHPTTQRWTRNVVQQPSAKKPYHLTRYRTQFTIRDASGNPAPGVALSINASEETAILVRGKTYFIGPSAEQTAVVKSDVSGVVTVTRSATSLACPYYTVTTGFGPLQNAYPDRAYHNLLSGTAPINTGSAVIPPMSKDALLNGTVNGKPLSPGLTGDAAGKAANWIINGMNSAPENSAAFLATGYVGWALSARDADHPDLRYFTDRDSLREHLKSLQADMRVGSIWSDIVDFFGDLWHALETAAIELYDAVVDVVDSLVNLTIKIGEDIVSGIVLVITSIADAIPFIHSIFNWIKVEVEKVLDWVKDLFGWHQIWNTKLVFEHMVAQALPALQWSIKQRAIVETGTFFKDLKADVDAQFQSALRHFENMSFGQLCAPPNASRSVRHHSWAPPGAPAGNPAQNNWLSSKVSDHIGGSGAFDPLSSSLQPDLAQTLWNAVTDPAVLKDLYAALADLGDFAKTLYAEPKNFLEREVSDLIKAAQALVDFVIDLLDSIVTHILDLMAGVIGTASDVLTQPLGDIPIVSWLYTNVICPSDHQEELTLLHLACVLFAVPFTLAYKFANHMKPPYDDAATQQILSLKFTPPGTAAPVNPTIGAFRPQSIVKTDPHSLSWKKGGGFFGLPHIVTDVLSDIAAGAVWEMDHPSTPPIAIGDDDDTLDLIRCLGFWNAIGNIIIQGFHWPDGPFNFNSWDKLQKGDRLSRIYWAVGWAMPVIELATLFLPSPSQGAIWRSIELGPKVGLTIYGATMMGLGLAAGIIGKDQDKPATADGYDIANVVISSVPVIATPLLFDCVIEVSESWSIGVKGFITGACDFTSAVFYMDELGQWP